MTPELIHLPDYAGVRLPCTVWEKPDHLLRKTLERELLLPCQEAQLDFTPENSKVRMPRQLAERLLALDVPSASDVFGFEMSYRLRRRELPPCLFGFTVLDWTADGCIDLLYNTEMCRADSVGTGDLLGWSKRN